MIFSIPGHIGMIRNGLTTHPLIPHIPPRFYAKTQTRRLNRGIYQVGRDYAVQRKRGVKAEGDIRIMMDRIWKEEPYWHCGSPISQEDAKAEGDYSPKEYEELFYKLYPKWNEFGRWAYAFHVIEVPE